MRGDEKFLISESYGSFKIQFNYIHEQKKHALSLRCSERDLRQSVQCELYCMGRRILYIFQRLPAASNSLKTVAL